MILDARTQFEGLEPEQWKAARRRVLVDGVPVPQAWYSDTDAGFVRTYDVFGDGKPHATATTPKPWPEDAEDRGDGVLTKTIYGKVEILPMEDE